MAKPILFVVHGMGVHKSGWEKEITSTLDNALSKYAAFEGTKLKDWMKIVPITYDNEFDKLRQLWKQDAAKVIQKMQAPDDSDKFKLLLGSFEGDKILQIQSELSEDSFFNTHILDILLYRFTALGEKIRVKVAKEIVKTLLAETEGAPQWSVMAHSLGTCVTHETLHALFANKIWREGKVKKLFVPNQFKAHSVIMLANVSRVLQSRVKAYKSRVKPGTGGMCNYFVNVGHQLDPCTMIKQFNPGDEWLAGEGGDTFTNIAINLINRVNVHGCAHCLDNPKVNAEVFRHIIGDFIIDDAELKKVYKAYFDASLNSQYDDLRKQLKNLNIGEPDSFQAVLESWKRFSDILQQHDDIV